MINQSEQERYTKIRYSAAMIADEYLFINISKIIESRKKVAIDIMKCQDDETSKKLMDLYEYFEQQLKRLLSL